LMIRAIRDVAQGRTAICPEIAEALALGRLEDGSVLEALSPREFEVLRMILATRSVDDIASALNLSRKTVLNYHYAIKTKLGVASDIELVYLG
ncbi:LuxR C-terminal-related transcriptional regulator, partial [Acinetobacter baumannii]